MHERQRVIHDTVAVARDAPVSEPRKIAAIRAADVVGYSRLAGADEERTLARQRGLRTDLIDRAAAHRGRIVKRTGDGSIIEFGATRSGCCSS
jgi:adenylate cyclase